MKKIRIGTNVKTRYGFTYITTKRSEYIFKGSICRVVKILTVDKFLVFIPSNNIYLRLNKFEIDEENS